MKMIKVLTLAAVAALVWSSPSWANPKHLQAYKKAYPDAKSKCIVCHIKDKVTKTDNELNAYGTKAKEMGDPSKEGYDAIGSAEAFEKAAAEAAGGALK